MSNVILKGNGLVLDEKMAVSCPKALTHPMNVSIRWGNVQRRTACDVPVCRAGTLAHRTSSTSACQALLTLVTSLLISDLLPSKQPPVII